jgi:tripartite-type tricarboxylate transporter receptor subunit TctC
MYEPITKKRLIWAFIPLLAVAMSATAQAQTYPSKPIKIIVAFPPGSTTDITARIVAQKLSESLAQPVIIENKPGAGGNLGAQNVARAAGDGYTLLATSVAFAVNQNFFKSPGYSSKDFKPVIKLGDTPNVFFANPATGVNTLKELVALSKTRNLNYASSGNGTTTHLSMEDFKVRSGMAIQHVPFAPAAAVTAVIGGQVEVGSTSLPPTVQNILAGKINGLATTGSRRSPALPGVPTVAELGYPDFEDYTWIAMFAPAATPSAVVERLNAEINKLFENAEVKEKFASIGFDVQRNSSTEFSQSLQRDVEKYAKLVKELGISAD